MSEEYNLRRKAAEGFKSDMHLPQRLKRQISKAVSTSNALQIQEQGWSKRSERPHGPLYDGWVKELQKAAVYASQLAFEVDCVDIAASLKVKRAERNALMDKVEVGGMVEGKEIRIVQHYLGEFGSYEGYIDGELIPQEHAKDIWNKVGSFAVSVENEVERMNKVYDADDYDDH